jgi:glutathione S-transferase
MKIYGDIQSGNCLKVRYTADLLGLSYDWIPIDVTKGEAKTPEFLKINSMGQVPAIELDDGRTLAQSNAIIRFLARGSRLLPDDAYMQAKIDELLFWEQYSHEPYVAVCRYHMFYLGKSKETRDPDRVRRGETALDWMEERLNGIDWFVGNAITVADISLVAYTRLGEEGGFDLSARKRLQAWIARCDDAIGL